MGYLTFHPISPRRVSISWAGASRDNPIRGLRFRTYLPILLFQRHLLNNNMHLPPLRPQSKKLQRRIVLQSQTHLHLIMMTPKEYRYVNPKTLHWAHQGIGLLLDQAEHIPSVTVDRQFKCTALSRRRIGCQWLFLSFFHITCIQRSSIICRLMELMNIGLLSVF